MNKIAVIGAGAAGMMAAITAASLGSPVTLYEKKVRVGQKILVTGNGKGNLSNMNMDAEEFYTSCPQRVRDILQRFSVADTITFFGKLGVMIRDKNGYLYPYAEQAQVVLDALRLRISELGVAVVCEKEITAITRTENPASKAGDLFIIDSNTYDRVIIAAGSMAAQKSGAGKSGYQIAEAFGHEIIPVVPGLCKLHCREEFLKALAGVRCQAKLTLLVNRIEGSDCDNRTIKQASKQAPKQELKQVQTEMGELQFVAGALSGIPVFQLSRTAAYLLAAGLEVMIDVDFFPDMSDDEYEDFCRQRLAALHCCGFHCRGPEQASDETLDLRQDKSLADFLLGMTHKKINQVLIRKHGFNYDDKVAEINPEKIWTLLMEYRKLRFHATEADSFENAQVCAGGVALDGLSKDLESLKIPGLYFAGEILDVDGRCGGYNLQWAWSSGYVAGAHAGTPN
jgi:predicted flavoprotein YhiN